MSEWQILQADSPEAALAAVLDAFQSIYRRYLADDLMLNHQLPFGMRGWQQHDDWYEGILLTPWMLAHVYFPRQPPVEPLAEGWEAESRAAADYRVIGPLLDFDIGEERPSAHVNYDPAIGHYLLRPLIQSLAKYRTADEVYAAWDGVLAARQAYRRQLEEERQAKAQEPVSRREFMTRWVRS